MECLSSSFSGTTVPSFALIIKSLCPWKWNKGWGSKGAMPPPPTHTHTYTYTSIPHNLATHLGQICNSVNQWVIGMLWNQILVVQLTPSPLSRHILVLKTYPPPFFFTVRSTQVRHWLSIINRELTSLIWEEDNCFINNNLVVSI
jgi:hypothetical protein